MIQRKYEQMALSVRKWLVREKIPAAITLNSNEDSTEIKGDLKKKTNKKNRKKNKPTVIKVKLLM